RGYTRGGSVSRAAEPAAREPNRAIVLRSEPGCAGGHHHAPIGALPALTVTDITNAGGAVNLLFAERARWLWLTAHRLGDLRRLVRPVAQGGYGRPANSVFPTGPYFKVNFANYGTDVNFPVPVTEKNNPNF